MNPDFDFQVYRKNVELIKINQDISLILPIVHLQNKTKMAIRNEEVEIGEPIVVISDLQILKIIEAREILLTTITAIIIGIALIIEHRRNTDQQT